MVPAEPLVVTGIIKIAVLRKVDDVTQTLIAESTCLCHINGWLTMQFLCEVIEFYIYSNDMQIAMTGIAHSGD